MAYFVQLQQFQGPLDLLLHLIEKAELDIKDIFISEITTQYLSYMQNLEGLDMDTASEFLAMAATLLYIKSRQLLPRPPKEAEQEEDPEVALIRQLREYKLYKEAGQTLQMLRERNQGVFFRLPEEIVLPEQKIEISGATLDMLYEAYCGLLNEHEQKPTEMIHEVLQDEFTVRQQLQIIRKALTKQKELSFEELFHKDTSKLEKIVTFMALFDMVVHGEVSLSQSKPFAPIMIRVLQLNLHDTDISYMDEV